MFGKNKIEKVIRDAHGALDVHSVFCTIQGEGPFAGRPSLFIRLYGCSLACSWCDTEFESQRVHTTPSVLMDTVESLIPPGAPRPLIVITGGEPMRQHLFPFARYAILASYIIQVETAGIHWEPELGDLVDDGNLHIICSPKTPVVRDEIEARAAAFKYIISATEESDPNDGLPLRAVSQRGQPQKGMLYRTPRIWHKPETVFVQPLDEQDAVLEAANRDYCAIIAMRHGYRLSLQLHKILGLA